MVFIVMFLVVVDQLVIHVFAGQDYFLQEAVS